MARWRWAAQRDTDVKVLSLILVAFNVLLWGGMSLLGVSLLQGVAAQHALGYPNAGQVSYYLAFPFVLLVASMARPIWLLRGGKKNLGIGALIGTLAVLPVYLFSYTGGV
jgi:hypothetical protein